MNPRMAAWTAAAVAVLLLGTTGCASRAELQPPSPASPVDPTDQPLPRLPDFDHIVLVMMENRSFADIIESGHAPYLSGLAEANGLATRYFPVTRGSLPNYLALAGGDTFGHSQTCSPESCRISAASFVDRLEASGKTWRAYMESMPHACDTSSTRSYTVGHNPFVYFDAIGSNPRRCRTHVVPLPQLTADLQSPASFANFVWITPNLCHDMHDCNVADGDRWLAQFLPTIFRSTAFSRQDSLLVLTWDEGNFTHPNQVATILVAPRHIPPGTRSAVRYSDYSLLRTLEVIWHLAPLTGNDARANPMADFFSTS